MYERMLNKQVIPTIEEMVLYCGENSELFAQLNEWLSDEYKTTQEVVFPYGKHYGWSITHRIKKKLICHIFAENNTFTIMIRLSHKQFEMVYEDVQKYTQDHIDNQYPCADGGWIHYRVINKTHLEDIKKLLVTKLK